MTRLPPADSLERLTAEEQGNLLDLLFEPSQDLRDVCCLLFGTTKISDYGDLIDAVKSTLQSLLESNDVGEIESLDRILQSHPRLGANRVHSVQSQAEQAQLHSPDEQSTQRLLEMNTKYEENFQGLKYVVFVNSRPRTAILEDMQARIDRNSIDQERLEAIQAICNIATDRVRKLSEHPHE